VDREKKTLAAGFSAAVAAVLLFGWLATQVLRGATQSFDAAVRHTVHAWASPWLTFLMLRVTRCGSELVLVPLGALIIWRLLAASRRHAAMMLAVASLGGESLNQILKVVFGRSRPDEAFFGYQLPQSYSFPSGHALVSCCFFGSLAAILTRRKQAGLMTYLVWAGASAAAALIGFSRVYLGVHYASDVLAGYAAAIVWVAAVRAAYGFWLRRRSRNREPAASKASES
jgi:undecaprenyl-diphosphatase